MVKKSLNGWYLSTAGTLIHYANNKRHNEKGPAIIWMDGTKFWCQNDKVHRLDGPAYEYFNGGKYWYYQGKFINCKSQRDFERYLKLKLLW